MERALGELDTDLFFEMVWFLYFHGESHVGGAECCVDADAECHVCVVAAGEFVCEVKVLQCLYGVAVWCMTTESLWRSGVCVLWSQVVAVAALYEFQC